MTGCVFGTHVVSFVTDRLGLHKAAFGVSPEAVGVERNGSIVAGVVYCNNNGHNLHAHIASDGGRKWASRSFLRLIFSYPFLTLGVPRITATTSERNITAQGFLRRLGFTHEATLVRAHNDGGDMLVFRMFREECPHIL